MTVAPLLRGVGGIQIGVVQLGLCNNLFSGMV